MTVLDGGEMSSSCSTHQMCNCAQIGLQLPLENSCRLKICSVISGLTEQQEENATVTLPRQRRSKALLAANLPNWYSALC